MDLEPVDDWYERTFETELQVCESSAQTYQDAVKLAEESARQYKHVLDELVFKAEHDCRQEKGLAIYDDTVQLNSGIMNHGSSKNRRRSREDIRLALKQRLAKRKHVAPPSDIQPTATTVFIGGSMALDCTLEQGSIIPTHTPQAKLNQVLMLWR